MPVVPFRPEVATKPRPVPTVPVQPPNVTDTFLMMAASVMHQAGRFEKKAPNAVAPADRS
jgi:hypothetical protein